MQSETLSAGETELCPSCSLCSWVSSHTFRTVSKGHKVGGQTPLHGKRENIGSPASRTNDLTAELLDKGARLLLKHPRKPVLHFLFLFYWCPKRKMFYLGQMEYWCSASSNSSGLQHCRKIENTVWSEPFPLIFLLGHQTGEKMCIYTFKR